MVYLSKNELLFDPKNKNIVEKFKKALKQKATIKRGSFYKNLN